MRSGKQLKVRLRKHLEGWDFRDVVERLDPIYPRVATLQTIAKSWVDFTRQIHAITLFGKGFGQLIQPSEPEMYCHSWMRIPSRRYYLAVSIADLKEIMAREGGDPTSHPLKVSEGIVWYAPGGLFERCQCRSQSHARHRHSDLGQVLLPSTLASLTPKPRGAQPELGDDGAVVFGYRSLFRWTWPDDGDPQPADAEPDEQAAEDERAATDPDAPSSSTATASFTPSTLRVSRTPESSQPESTTTLPRSEGEERPEGPEEEGRGEVGVWAGASRGRAREQRDRLRTGSKSLIRRMFRD